MTNIIKTGDNVLIEKAKKLGIETNITKRWETGMAHHPKSFEMMMNIQSIDWLFNHDYFQWKVGGDGDNGETLMYVMDIIFEIEGK